MEGLQSRLAQTYTQGLICKVTNAKGNVDMVQVVKCLLSKHNYPEFKDQHSSKKVK
jgi:hypothetical protein